MRAPPDPSNGSQARPAPACPHPSHPGQWPLPRSAHRAARSRDSRSGLIVGRAPAGTGELPPLGAFIRPPSWRGSDLVI